VPMSEAEARKVKRWAIHALVRSALDERPPRARKG